MSTIDPSNNILSEYGLDTSYISESTSSGNDMGMDTFLQLMVTQMQYQDPLEPTSNEDFLAQLAQYSSLEQMQNMSTTLEMSEATSMIGQIIQANVKNDMTGEVSYVEGFVDSVRYDSGDTFLVVDGVDVSLEDVLSVSYYDYETQSIAELSEINSSMDALSSISESIEEINQKIDKLQEAQTGTETLLDTLVTDE